MKYYLTITDSENAVYTTAFNHDREGRKKLGAKITAMLQDGYTQLQDEKSGHSQQVSRSRRTFRIVLGGTVDPKIEEASI